MENILANSPMDIVLITKNNELENKRSQMPTLNISVE
jgi:hypothetical protein